MKLTELIIALAVFLIACTAFSSSLINVRRGVGRSEDYSNRALALLDADASIRREIKKIKVPYWKNFEKEFEKEKTVLEEHLKVLGNEKGFEINGIDCVYDRSHKSEGVKVNWKIYGKEYECCEFIKQRIVDGE